MVYTNLSIPVLLKLKAVPAQRLRSDAGCLSQPRRRRIFFSLIDAITIRHLANGAAGKSTFVAIRASQCERSRPEMRFR